MLPCRTVSGDLHVLPTDEGSPCSAKHAISGAITLGLVCAALCTVLLPSLAAYKPRRCAGAEEGLGAWGYFASVYSCGLRDGVCLRWELGAVWGRKNAPGLAKQNF